ncbi:bromodomain-containing protein 8 isoform X2 [Denticeps clupeoides]|uniref:bromodomain-containing protein 8 isoform X2 n=1 Tax=Denticeps clupeoides TaxID=299321 RepID=UPI0010A3627E|nr:bromodomain-containing protein 8 isoform X2 [Denticeps clupeoides]
MASGVGKHKLLSLGPTEPWSVSEKLCLASSVMKSGDQNWVSVSRAIKPFAEPGRPPDWFSQKHCASQYSELLETTETPKRKRGEKGEVVETIEDVIVRKLTAERIEELKRLIKDTQEKHRKLKREAELIQAGNLDSKLEELWGDILQKKKQEEEEAEMKRKATDAAYQARQAVKNAPKRLSGVTVRSPTGASSPSLDFSLSDTPLSTPDEPSASTQASAAFLPLSDGPGPGVVESGLGALLDDSPQKKLLGQKATPPPSPLLSELLKKGSLLPTSPRLVGEGDVPGGHMAGAHALPASQAATGAPTLSRLLEAGPAQFPSPLGSLATADAPTASAVPALDPATSLSTGVDVVTASVSGVLIHPDSAEHKAVELAEDDLVTVSYMGEELDLETVGDIIAIIEDKGDENAEALDAAAVEAALSLCEESGHALSGPWETDPPILSGAPPSSACLHEALEVNRDVLEARAEGCRSQDQCVPVFPQCSGPVMCDQTHTHEGHTSLSHPIGQAGRKDDQTECPASSHPVIKCETEEWTSPPLTEPVTEDSGSALSKVPKVEKEEEEELLSDGEEGSVSELKEGQEEDAAEECGLDEEGEGAEPYLSEAEGEAELEPPASESEDGYSMHTASSSLQLHTTADSIPSSPASSQFSISSEDQEAIQAQKIWKKAIMLVWRAAANHRYANVFLQPVTDDIAPGYHSIVHRPMDLSTIKKNIETGLIRTTAEFQRDIMLMFQNAVMYNSSDHDVFHMALEMQRDVLEQIQQFLATQLIMQTSESSISAKSLRGRETNRKQDPNDKDGGTRGRRCAIEADLKMKK